MTESEKGRISEPVEKDQEQDKERENKPSSGSAFEGIYERLPDISIRSLDWFIAACVIALVAVVVIGVLKARHII